MYPLMKVVRELSGCGALLLMFSSQARALVRGADA